VDEVGEVKEVVQLPEVAQGLAAEDLSTREVPDLGAEARDLVEDSPEEEEGEVQGGTPQGPGQGPALLEDGNTTDSKAVQAQDPESV